MFDMLKMSLSIFTFAFYVACICNAFTPTPPLYAQFDGPILHKSYITRATIRIIQDEYAAQSNSLAITCATTSLSGTIRQSGFLNEVLGNTPTHIAITIEDAEAIGAQKSTNGDNDDNVSQYRFYNVFLVDSYVAFQRIYGRMTDQYFDYTGLYTIILTESSRYQYDSITRILQDCWSRYITNVIVLVAIDPLARTAVYTYFPYTAFHCEAVAPVIHNYYQSNGFLYTTALFPNKVHNMYGCAILVAAYTLPPFMMLTPAQRLGIASYHTDGIDGIVVRVLSQRLNFTAVVSVPADGQNRGEIVNQTGTGAVGMVLRHEVNFTIGAVPFSASKARALSATFPYYQASAYFAVPRGRDYTAFEKLFMPFKTTVWSCTLAMYIVAAIIFAILRCAGRQRLAFVFGVANHTPLLGLFAILLGATASPTLPTRNFARFVLVVWTLGCIVLRNSYQGALFHFMQTPMTTAPIGSISELVSHNYTLRMAPDLFALFDETSQLRSLIKASRYKNNWDEFNELIQSPTNRDVYITTDVYAGYYNMKHRRNRSVVITHERLFAVQYSIFFRKHSCLTETINEQVQKYYAHGLLSNWVSLYFNMRLARMGNDKKAAAAAATSNSGGSGGRKALRVEQVMGAFQIGAYMMGFSGMVLALEVMSARCDMLRRLFEWL